MEEVLGEMNRQGISKTELSRRLRITKPSVIGIFRSKNLTLGTMMRVAEAIGCAYEVKPITPNQTESTYGE